MRLPTGTADTDGASPANVLVVGAGPAGLAVGGCLARAARATAAVVERALRSP